MEIGNIFVIVFLSYYTIYFFSFFSDRKRYAIQDRNIKLNEMRSKKIKTLQEQKDFINLKYPKKGKIIFTWGMIPRILYTIFVFGLIFFIYQTIFIKLNIYFLLWQGILIIVVLPIIINIILSRFKLQKDDIRIFFR